jgi:hypothetical protein
LAYSVIFNTDLSQVPDSVIAELQKSLTLVGDSISTIPETNAFWVSIDDSFFEITIDQWRFSYIIARKRQELIVVGVRKLERQTA